MKKHIFIILVFGCLTYSSTGQTKEDFSDKFLTSSFKVFQSADFELAQHILPFLRKRFTNELEDTSSFYNPYDSLSKHISIMYSADRKMKTYCWSERNGSCCHTSATFAQFITESGTIKYVDLEEFENSDEDIFITDLQNIEIQNKPYYLILGWGTCCGGKQYEVARVFEIIKDTLIKSDSIFNNETEIYVGANRYQKIELKYSSKQKILSYNKYDFDENEGFYTEEKYIVKWNLTEKGFVKLN
jgi:hypothetical protein